jgi:hypothetical protein
MPTLYVRTARESTWHILRRNEQRIVWCSYAPVDLTWNHSSLRTPAVVCGSCRDSEVVNRAADLDRVPGLASAFSRNRRAQGRPPR